MAYKNRTPIPGRCNAEMREGGEAFYCARAPQRDKARCYDHRNASARAVVAWSDPLTPVRIVELEPADVLASSEQSALARRRDELDELAATIPDGELSDFLDGYVAAAIWSSTDEDDEPLDSHFGPDDVGADTLEEMREAAIAFYGVHRDELRAAGVEPGQAGHDFWLTRNHHGTGFWDRGLGELGDRLTEDADAFGESHLFVSGRHLIAA